MTTFLPPSEWPPEMVADRIDTALDRSDHDAARYLIAELVQRVNVAEAQARIIDQDTSWHDPHHPEFTVDRLLGRVLAILDEHSRKAAA